MIARRRPKPAEGGLPDGAAAGVVDMSPLLRLVGFQIHMFDLVTYQRFYERYAGEGFTPAIFSTLTVIERNPGIRHGALAGALRIQRPNLTALINALERRSLVKRRAGAADGRSVALYLTERGKRAQARMLDLMRDFDRDAASVLSARERQSLLTLLQKAMWGGRDAK
jgi:DNA-binding MarR family transcriptional regulator